MVQRPRFVAPRVRARLLAALAVALVLAAPAESLAAPIPITVPTSLNPGDQYRLVFVTRESRDSTSLNIADYNAFVTTQANAVPELAALGATWTAIASTSTVDARDNTNTNPNTAVGVPIFNLNELLVANDNADLWDDTLANPVLYDENAFPFSVIVVTGTNVSGQAAIPLGGGAGSATAGQAALADFGWINAGTRPRTEANSFYGLSSTLTVIPEPGTAALLMLGLVGLAAVRRNVGTRGLTGTRATQDSVTA